MVYEEQTDKYCQSDTSVSENKDTQCVFTMVFYSVVTFEFRTSDYLARHFKYSTSVVLVIHAKCTFETKDKSPISLQKILTFVNNCKE